MAAVVALALGGCTTREIVVVYSPHGAEVMEDYEARFEAAHPDIDLQWFAAGAKEVHARVMNERHNPACDVWWGAPSTLFLQAAHEGLLEPYAPDWAEHLPPAYKDPEGRWHATYISPLAILFNTTAYAADAMPDTWDGLLDPRWRGRVVLRSPLASGTMRTFLCAMIARQPDVDAGIAWLRRLAENTARYPESPNLLYDHLKKNPERIAAWLLPDIVMQRDRNGFPFGFRVPRETPVITDCIAIVRNAPNPEGARKFHDFVTTREALAHQAEAYAKMPARADIPREDLPAWMAAQEIEAMDIDWAAFAAVEDAWCKRWEREVLRAP